MGTLRFGSVHSRRRGAPWLACAVVGLAIAACSSSGGSSGVKAAQANVSAKQSAVDKAKADLTAKTDAFCKSAADYITALDRYGDILNQTEPTVGDVKDAGQDLAQPRQDALTSAQAAVSAQDELVKAKNDLKHAKAALKTAQASASSKPVPTIVPSSATATPLASSASVNRVKQADADFSAALHGITDATPLSQASEDFNAAAVALEMSWLKLFSDAGCLTNEQQQQAAAAVSAYTSALQKSLADAGYYNGKVDGVYGPATVAAVEALQKAHGLPVTGTVDKATAAALQSDLSKKGGAAAQEELVSTTAVQQTLKLAGFWDRPVDGKWTPALTDALKSFQKALGVKPTGTVDAATISALNHAIANVKSAKQSQSASAPATSTPPALPRPSVIPTEATSS